MLKTYGILGPTEAEYPNYNVRLAALVRTVEAETLLGHIPGGQYDAVLIDEAHDFEPEWLSLAVKMVNPNTKAFMIAYDDMQAIYKGRRRPVLSLLGIEAMRRTRVLKLYYRNTVQILGLAQRVGEEWRERRTLRRMMKSRRSFFSQVKLWRTHSQQQRPRGQ
jgi:superfamily I DNA/RNA helicase